MSKGDGEQKELIQYPTTYTFKVMGRQEGDFVGFIRELFGQLMAVELEAEQIQQQPSSKGNYVSLSVTVVLVSEDQRRAIYGALHREKRIVFYL